jgi:uncharacterized RDD family membrane protein YckC
MNTSEGDPGDSELTRRDDPTAVPYLCVCGEQFAVDMENGGQCPACRRRVSPAALVTGRTATVTFPAGKAVPGGPAESDQPPEDDERIGQSFGHYRIVRRLGRGGMGAVYEAHDESLQRYVALKVIHMTGRSSADTQHIERLLQEAIAQARVNHPNVVHIYYVGREERVPFFAMELVPGPTLADRLKEGPLPFREVITFAEQVVDALGHAARFDIVHGDVKPSNILMVDAQTVKLSDFGLARRLSQVTQDPVLVAGTPNYLSPEASEGKPQDIRSDMYSLGITLFELTFGRLPYSMSGSNFFDYVRVHRTAAVEFPDPWPESVPYAWRAVLERLLAKSPEDRYQDYDQLLADVRRLRPVALPPAGRVQRALAWLVDLGLAHAAQNLFYAHLAAGGAAAAAQSSPPGLVARVLLTLLGGLVPPLAAYLQMRWQTTPGKRLFQLRIVDRHGLTPRNSILAVRSVFQFLPLWAALVFQLCASLGRENLGGILVAFAPLWLLLDVLFTLLHRDRIALHDVLLGTRVVLDARDKDQPRASA